MEGSAIFTSFSDVNELLEPLLTGARTALGENFLGLYLHGSLAMGAFDPRTSDIDFVVATEGELSQASVSALEALHSQLALRHPRLATDLEGSYIPRADLRRYDRNRAYHLHVFTGRVLMEYGGLHQLYLQQC